MSTNNNNSSSGSNNMTNPSQRSQSGNTDPKKMAGMDPDTKRSGDMSTDPDTKKSGDMGTDPDTKKGNMR